MLKSGIDDGSREALLELLDSECLDADLTTRYWEQLAQDHQRIALVYQTALAFSAVLAGSTSVVGFWPQVQPPASAITAILAALQPFLPWLAQTKRLSTLAGHWSELQADFDSFQAKSPRMPTEVIEEKLNGLLDRVARLAKDETGLPKNNLKLKTTLYKQILVERGRKGQDE